MILIPNLLSLMRFPLALIFLQENPFYRTIAIILALVTDGLDGFIARRYKITNRLGTVLDPMMDKFFVFFVLVIFVRENRLSWMEAALLFCRDFSVISYGIYLALRQRLLNYRFRAIWSGKITTVLQLFVLLALTFSHSLSYSLPPYFYAIFIILGVLAFIELFHNDKDYVITEDF
jgi:CDP-diacylglycerol---glycerol-3-phosphate 3-phosphatidyltransferase